MTTWIGRAGAILSLMLLADPAFAHHVMGGAMPVTFGQGLLSGLGHPVIGLDHLAFLVAVGVVVGIAGINLLLPLAFVLASPLGAALHVKAIAIPGPDLTPPRPVILTRALVPPP